MKLRFYTPQMGVEDVFQLLLLEKPKTRVAFTGQFRKPQNKPRKRFKGDGAY